ncbi:hypothetical protein [uncultured Ruminococcus sp.]|uniref:hypothetical protein n=1 Tax=uncultured Ruminococcus sp. TaxID=165186 RepID=UPI002618C0B2|nr:hypothetical protein [uncultured Ruminococcus sp.]
MKKIYTSFFIVVSLILGCIHAPFNAMAESFSPVSYYEYYDNGFYAEVTVSIDHANLQKSVISGSKTYNYKNSSNQVLWSYTIYGTFSYNGASATCTYDDDSYDIKDNNWHINSHSHYRSGNTAYGQVTMDKTFLGITIETITRNLTLSCSPDGTLY